MNSNFGRSGAAIAFAILITACSSGIAGGGGDGGAEQQTLNCPQGTHQVNHQCVQNPPATLSQANVDDNTATTIVSGMADIYNQNLAGKPTGSHDVMVNCPVGGTAHVTGTVSLDSTHNITSVTLTIVMTGCKLSSVSTSGNVNIALTLDGTISESGSWDGSTYASVNYQASGLTMSGTDQWTGYTPATIGQACDVGLTYDVSGSTSTVSGNICGRTASSSG